MSHTFIKKTLFTITIFSILFGLCSCSSSDKEKELAAFSKSIASFSDYLTNMNDKISTTDLDSDHAKDDILSYLDDLDQAFSKLADMKVPVQYDAITSLADEASENMSRAVSMYHDAYESEEFDEQDAEIAYEYYLRAMTRVTYIGNILEGKIPEGENVTVYETNIANEVPDELQQ